MKLGLFAAIVVLASGAGRGLLETAALADEKASPMQGDQEAEWRAAERLVRKKFDGILRRSHVERVSPRLRYAFIVTKIWEPYRRVVVHRGAVLEGGGLAALGSYLRDTELLERRELDVNDLLYAVLAFGALPPGHPKEDYYDRQTGWLADTNPKLTYADHAAVFELTYHLGTEGENSLHRHGSLAGPPLFYFERCTLSVPATYQLAWQCTNFERRRPKE